MANELIDLRRPNWTVYEPTKPGTALMDPKRPNWTVPRAVPKPVVEVDPKIAEAARARTASIRAGQPTAAPAVPTPAPTSAPGGLARTIRGAGSAALPMLAGAGAAAYVNTQRQSALNNQPAFVPPANQNAPGQIPVDPTQTGPAPVAGRFLDQSELGRNIGNAAMALGPGRLAGPAAALGLGAASNAIRAAAPAARAGRAATQGFAVGDAVSGRILANGVPPPPVDSGSQAAAGMAMRRGNARDAAQPPGVPDGAIVRNGNSYSGAPNIRFGADIVDPNGKVLNSADPEAKTGGYGVSSVGNGDGGLRVREIDANVRRINAEMAQTQKEIDAYGPGSHEVARPPSDALRIAEMENDTVRRGQDVVAGTSRAKTAADVAAAQRVQANEDRKYQFDVAKYGEEAAGKRADRRAAATKNLYEEIGNMIPPGADGKPDMATAARYAEGLNALLAEQTQAAQAELERNPGNAAAKSFLANVEENGPNAMSAVAKRKFIAGQQAAEKAKDSAGWLPWKGTDPKSAAGVSGLRSRPGFIWDDYETLDAQGRVTGTIPASRVDEDRNLDILKR